MLSFISYINTSQWFSFSTYDMNLSILWATTPSPYHQRRYCWWRAFMFQHEQTTTTNIQRKLDSLEDTEWLTLFLKCFRLSYKQYFEFVMFYYVVWRWKNWDICFRVICLQDENVLYRMLWKEDSLIGKQTSLWLIVSTTPCTETRKNKTWMFALSEAD